MGDMERRQELAEFLRTRRERLTPQEVGLPPGFRRRTTGLRREEVAQLANIGTSWYISLEQAREVRPSEQVLESLAQALRLTSVERQHLFLLALQHAPANLPSPQEEVSPALEQVIRALDPNPAYIEGRRWDLLLWNRAAQYVFDFTEFPSPYSRNMFWRYFSRLSSSKRANWEKVAQVIVAEFRADSARYPGDPGFRELIEELQRTSSEFRELWGRHDVEQIEDRHKQFEHPRLGHLEFDHVTLQAPTSPDLKVKIYTGTPATVTKLAQFLKAIEFD
ncbi:MAG TPA: helix-turn-helix transcriptional regulator [Chloroflexia bacterium]|nr:helix-turn-helix transcriptional regulator [Chloroflexia bacterium]